MKMAESSSNGYKTLGKGEIACYVQLILFSQGFYPFLQTRKNQGLFGKDLIQLIVRLLTFSRQKTLTEKKTILVSSFFFQVIKTQDCTVNGFNLSQTIPGFDVTGLKGFWKHCGKKEKMLVTSIFSFFHNVFYPVKHKFYFLSHIYFVICTCF